MAQDSPAQAQPGQEVDIDELEVEIMIIAKSPNGLKQTCAFLTRRGWPTTAHGNLSKAIEEIAEKRPDIVMVSFNHPSPGVLRLPEIFAQTFNLICVGFVEGTDTSSTSKLNNIKIRHKIFGTPSGPNFHRGIRRILAEKFNVKLDEKPGDTKEAKENSVTIRGSKGEEESQRGSNRENLSEQKRGPAIISGKSGEDSQLAGDASVAYSPSGPSSIQKPGSNGAPGLESSGPSISGPQGPTSIMQSGDKDPLSAMQAGHGTGQAKSEMQEGHGSAESKSARQAGTHSESPSRSGDQDRDDLGRIMQMGKEFGSRGQSALSNKRKKLKALTASEVDRNTAGNMLFGEKLDSDVPQPEAPVSADLVGMLKKSIFENDGEDKSPQSVLEKAVEEALKQVCQNNPDIRPIGLNLVGKIGVFPIDSAALPGYLVLAVSSGLAEDEKRFLKNCEIALRTSFDALGVAGKLEGGFWLDVPQVDFETWAQNAGTFSFRLPHLGQEIGVSYFQTEKPIAKAKPARQKDMHTIALADISTEEAVTFKTFLYLRQNEKFYLYLRNGRRLQPEQKQRLEANDIGEVFMKSIDVENFRKFLASVYLKETIRSTASDEAA